MATEHVETGAHGTNGTAAPSASDLRSQILAEAADLAKSGAKVGVKPAIGEPVEDDEEQVEQTDDADAETAAQDDADPEVEAAADDDTEPTEDDDAEETETSDDPATQKRLDAVRKAEQRYRAKMAEGRQAFEAEQKKHAERIEKAEQFEAASRRAKYDPAALLRAAGLTEDDFELAAHAIYAESKAAAADPKRKEAAAARLREREKEDKLTATEKKMAELERKLEEQAQAAKAQAATARYVADIESVAKTKHPLVAHMLKVDPDDAGEGIRRAYEALGQKTGKTPAPAAVVAEYDRMQRAKLKRLGIDPDTIAKSPIVTTIKKKAAAATTAKGAANSNAASKAPTKEEILAELRAGALDD